MILIRTRKVTFNYYIKKQFTKWRMQLRKEQYFTSYAKCFSYPSLYFHSMLNFVFSCSTNFEILYCWASSIYFCVTSRHIRRPQHQHQQPSHSSPGHNAVIMLFVFTPPPLPLPRPARGWSQRATMLTFVMISAGNEPLQRFHSHGGGPY